MHHVVHRLTDHVPAAAPSYLQHGLVLQVNDDAKFYVLHIPMTKYAVEAKYFCAVAVN